MRQPPIIVPAPIAVWHASTTQRGTSLTSWASLPDAMSTAKMMPIVFCASLPPWPKLYAAADTSCNLRKRLLMRDRGRRDDALADRRGHLRLEEQERDEVEERGPHHGVVRLQHARRDDRGDRVRRVVEAVDEVEAEGQRDDRPDDPVGGHFVTVSR